MSKKEPTEVKKVGVDLTDIGNIFNQHIQSYATKEIESRAAKDAIVLVVGEIQALIGDSDSDQKESEKEVNSKRQDPAEANGKDNHLPA